jgi:hypothetical protein
MDEEPNNVDGQPQWDAQEWFIVEKECKTVEELVSRFTKTCEVFARFNYYTVMERDHQYDMESLEQGWVSEYDKIGTGKKADLNLLYAIIRKVCREPTRKEIREMNGYDDDDYNDDYDNNNDTSDDDNYY